MPHVRVNAHLGTYNRCITCRVTSGLSALSSLCNPAHEIFVTFYFMVAKSTGYTHVTFSGFRSLSRKIKSGRVWDGDVTTQTRTLDNGSSQVQCHHGGCLLYVLALHLLSAPLLFACAQA